MITIKKVKNSHTKKWGNQKGILEKYQSNTKEGSTERIKK